jgi:hypothetical protein|tara:strand:- start:184 stop:336 length:153 start_codon:yes stop_codon:yes gene_type:complete
MKTTTAITITIPTHIWKKFIKYRKILKVSGLCTMAIEQAIIAIEKSDIKL